MHMFVFVALFAGTDSNVNALYPFGFRLRENNGQARCMLCSIAVQSLI